MQNSFTIEDLVLLLYKETDVSTSLKLYEALEAQPALLEAFEQLSQAKQQLPQAQFSPSKDTIANILDYSQHHTLSLDKI
ncbi:MAG: hypothetical protein AAF847_05655 [Bacteroidota bacterium]